MAFGQEVKDFIGGFKVGYDMFDSKEEREEKRAKRKREQEAHDRAGRWRDEDNSYRRERAAIGDDQWERGHGMREKEFDFRQRESGRAHARWEEQFKSDQDKYKIDKAKESGVRDTRGITDHMDRNGIGAIPEDGSSEDVSYNGNPNVHLASYSADSAAATAVDTGGFNLETYLPSIAMAESGGRLDAKNPLSSATGLYQPLQGTWNAVAKKYPELGLTADGRGSREQQERFIRRFTYDNGKALASAGIPVTNGTMYAAHFLGAGGAKRVLRADPSTPISRLVGSDVMSANPFLKGMTVGDFEAWADRKGNGRRRRRGSGGGALSAAVGGMVTAIPDEDEDEPNLMIPDSAFMDEAPAEETTQVAQAAIPMPGDKPQYEGVSEGNKEEPTNDPWEAARRSVRDGLNRSLKNSGLDANEAISDPQLEEIRQNYLKGYGAAPNQMMRQVMDRIDPDKKMPTSERNMMAMGTVYQYYVEQGDLEKAQDAAASMVQYYRMASSRFLALGQAAAEKGELSKAAQAAVAAYANIPNGRDMQIEENEDGSFNITVTDEKTGKTVNRQVVSPKEFAAAAMQFNPNTFDEEILNAAGAPPPDSKRSTSASDARLGGEAIDLAAEEFFEGTNLTRRQQSTIKDVAANLHLTGENQMSPAVALDFATRLSEFNADDPEDDSAPFTVKPVRGNPSEVNVTVDGRTVTMSRSNLNSLLHMRESAVKGRAAGRKKQAEVDASRAKTRENARKFIESLRGTSGAPTPVNPGVIPEGEAVPGAEGQDPEVEELLRLRNTLKTHGRGDRATSTRLAEIEERLRALGVLPPEE